MERYMAVEFLSNGGVKHRRTFESNLNKALISADGYCGPSIAVYDNAGNYYPVRWEGQRVY